MKYVIVRKHIVHLFLLESWNQGTGKKVVLRNARRIYYWSGAANPSQLAMEGTKDPTNQISCPVDRVELLQ